MDNASGYRIRTYFLVEVGVPAFKENLRTTLTNMLLLKTYYQEKVIFALKWHGLSWNSYDVYAFQSNNYVLQTSEYIHFLLALSFASDGRSNIIGRDFTYTCSRHVYFEFGV